MKPLPNFSKVKALTHLHAHNDSSNLKPLWTALSLGYTSIEVDVRLIKGELYAAHDRPLFVNPNRKLTTLYLDPLLNYFQQHSTLYENNQSPFYLMLDIKSKPVKTYKRIQKELIPYQSILSCWKNNKVNANSINILISGTNPTELIHAEKDRWVQVDGRISDIGKGYPPDFMPLISAKLSHVIGWNFFRKKPTETQFSKIKKIADAIHAEGKRFRLWKTPEDEFVCKLLCGAGVDVLNAETHV